MKSNTKNSMEKMYVFAGIKFAEYIDMEIFKERIEKELDIPLDDLIGLGDIHSKINIEKPKLKKKLDEIFFECILYSHLKHVYINTFNTNIKVSGLKQNMKKIIQKHNYKENIASALYQDMSEDGFFLMDKLNISSPNTKFIAGFDYKSYGDNLVSARIIFVEVVPVGDRSEYFIAGVDINFKTNTYMIMIRNKQNINKSEDIENAKVDKTTYQLYKRVKDSIIAPLLSNIEYIDVKKDRTGMYNLCKELDEQLLKNIRDEVINRTSKTLSASVYQLLNHLFQAGKKPKKRDQHNLKENISSLLIATYIKTNFKGKDLVKKAKEKNLVGYPTKIKFTSNRASRGSTQSSSSKQPVSASDMFHSLYISFRDALGLEQWSISWFTDFEFKDPKNFDVIQTTIYSKSTYFEVVFKPHRALNKEVIYHVVEYLNNHRK